MILQYENNNLKIVTEKGVNKPMFEHDAALQEFINTRIDRTKVASMIYSINQNQLFFINRTGGQPCWNKGCFSKSPLEFL